MGGGGGGGNNALFGELSKGLAVTSGLKKARYLYADFDYLEKYSILFWPVLASVRPISPRQGVV